MLSNRKKFVGQLSAKDKRTRKSEDLRGADRSEKELARVQKIIFSISAESQTYQELQIISDFFI